MKGRLESVMGIHQIICTITLSLIFARMTKSLYIEPQVCKKNSTIKTYEYKRITN